MRAARRLRWVSIALAISAALALIAPPLSATIEEQRARLPPPATCVDPAEGIWMAMRYRRGGWARFTLEIHRVKPGAPDLVGEIKNRFWYGPSGIHEPPPCGPGDYLVKMPGKGLHHPDGRVRFDGGSWQNDPAACTPYLGRYNPDHFSGTIDPLLQEFQSVNNDGGAALNEAYVFRRVRCFDAPAPEVVGPQRDVLPAASITLPAFSPPLKRSGCGR